MLEDEIKKLKLKEELKKEREREIWLCKNKGITCEYDICSECVLITGIEEDQ